MRSTPPYAPRHARRARRWIARLASGGCTVAELDRLHAWLARDPRHRAAFGYQRALWQSLEPVREQVLAAQPGLLQPSPRRPARPAWQPALAAAAVLALAVLLLPGSLVRLQADHYSGQLPRSVQLDDGSEMVLDAASAVAVSYTDDMRRIRMLRGRAWFRVAHEARPFHVRMPQGTVRDIGTAFTVELVDDHARVQVSDGAVEVLSGKPGLPGTILRAGQAAHLQPDRAPVAVDGLDANAVGAWRHGEIMLVGEDARSAIDLLARYRRAPVWVLPGTTRPHRVTAVFHMDSADAAIHSVARQAGWRVRTLPGGALLVHPGD